MSDETQPNETPEDVKDTGDLVQPTWEDVTPDEVKPGDPDYVEPYKGATPIPREA